MTLRAFLELLVRDGEFDTVALNNFAQFGAEGRPYLGTQFLPERNVAENMFREGAVRYRTVIANDGTRYSPVQHRAGGELSGSFAVELGSQDIGRTFNSDDYDGVRKFLATGANMEAAAKVIGWSDQMINIAMIETIEKQRWQAVVDSQVLRQGDNGYREVVNYVDPAGHRVAAGGNWSDPTYDPFDDIITMKELLEDKGYEVTGTYCSTTVQHIMLRNPLVKNRVGATIITPTAVTTVNTVQYTQTTDAALATAFAAVGVPAPSIYNKRYWTQSASFRFLTETVLVFVCSTGQDVEVRSNLDPDTVRFIPDTLGYAAVGIATGQATPGRVIRLEAFENKPPRLEAEGWQMSLPVITEPEALGVITTIQ
ncbi:MAG: hypothetical protein GY938_12920 [Ketobacter sp.]|nr:hypothetical protein [Ketobacter sp.]